MNFDIRKRSKLTTTRPDIWERCLSLAMHTTSYKYPHKADESPMTPAAWCNPVSDRHPIDTMLEPGVVEIPEGAVEWLLHEVGHWVMSKHKGTDVVNYGLSLDSIEEELLATAFQDIVFSPWDGAYSLAPKTVIAELSDPKDTNIGFAQEISREMYREAEKRAIAAKIDFEYYCTVFGEWAEWELGRQSRLRNSRLIPGLSVGVRGRGVP